MNLLQACDLTFGVPGRKLCQGLNLAIEAGQCWAILGPNGAGKTTLLHTLAGLLPAQHGRLLLNGTDIHSYSSSHRARQLGLLPQDDMQGFPLSLLEATLNGRHPYLGRWGWETEQDIGLAMAALAAVGLAGWENRVTGSLSGGERRRLAIATLLTQTPSLALLDEPSNHLDLGHQIELLGLLCERFSGDRHALVMVLHDINLALRFCDHLLLLPGNGSWQGGMTTDLATEENLSRLYGHRLQEMQGPKGHVFLPR